MANTAVSKPGRKQGRYLEQALSAASVRTVTKPGRYCDGHGLYLLVTNTGGALLGATADDPWMPASRLWA